MRKGWNRQRNERLPHVVSSARTQQILQTFYTRQKKRKVAEWDNYEKDQTKL